MEKMEPGSDNEPDLSVRTSVAKHSLRFNTSIMKLKEKEKKVLEPIYLKQLMATTKLAPVLNHLSEREK